MKRAVVGACVAFAFTVTVGAQGKTTERATMDHMPPEKTYSGCVESSDTGSYILTHPMMAAAQESMKKDESMAHDAMAPASLALSAAARSVDLSKHVGHKVTVTGTEGDSMNGMAAFKVKSLKVIGATCS